MGMKYTERRFLGGLYYPCVDFKSARNDVVAAVSDEEHIARAMKLLENNPGEAKPYAACYVIGVAGEDVCKVGFSRHPLRRLRHIRQSLPKVPRVFALFWGFEAGAGNIERAALNAARAEGVRGNGEWLNMPAAEGVRYVLDKSWGVGLFTDSEAFVESWLFKPRGDAPTSYWTDERLADAIRRHEDATFLQHASRFGWA